MSKVQVGTRTAKDEAECRDLHYFQWRVPQRWDEYGYRLVTPHSDPSEHEQPFNFIWASEQEARDGLDMWGVEEEALEEGWILVEYHGKIVGEATDES